MHRSILKFCSARKLTCELELYRSFFSVSVITSKLLFFKELPLKVWLEFLFEQKIVTHYFIGYFLKKIFLSKFYWSLYHINIILIHINYMDQYHDSYFSKKVTLVTITITIPFWEKNLIDFRLRPDFLSRYILPYKESYFAFGYRLLHDCF